MVVEGVEAVEGVEGVLEEEDAVDKQKNVLPLLR